MIEEEGKERSGRPPPHATLRNNALCVSARLDSTHAEPQRGGCFV